jgi:hypothetical protein
MVHTTIPEARYHPKSTLSHATPDFCARASNHDKSWLTRICKQRRAIPPAPIIPTTPDPMLNHIWNNGFTKEDSPLWLKRRHPVVTKRTDDAEEGFIGEKLFPHRGHRPPIARFTWVQYEAPRTPDHSSQQGTQRKM